jgi:hypothetical protein
MHRALLSAVLSLSVLLSTLVVAQDASYTFTTIDVPGAIEFFKSNRKLNRPFIELKEGSYKFR